MSWKAVKEGQPRRSRVAEVVRPTGAAQPTIRQWLGHVVIEQVNPPGEGRLAGLILLRTAVCRSARSHYQESRAPHAVEARASHLGFAENRGLNSFSVGVGYLHVAIDDFLGYAYAESLPNERGATAAESLSRALQHSHRQGSRRSASSRTTHPKPVGNRFLATLPFFTG